MLLAQRGRERELLIYCLAFLIVGFAILKQIGNIGSYPILPIVVLGIIYFGSHVILMLKRPFSDNYLISLVFMLITIGLLFLYRLDPLYGEKQLIWVVLGFGVLWLTIFLTKDYDKLYKYKYLYIILGLLALLSPILFGNEVGGAKSWLALGNIKFQPAEVVKIFVVIFLASFLEERKELLTMGTRQFKNFTIPDPKYFGPLLIIWGLTLIILLFQRDLGTALIFFGTFLAMLYCATGRLSFVSVGLILFMLGAYFCYLKFGHVQTRVEIWLNPWPYAEGKSYQIIQSLFALGSGGVYGTGIGVGYPGLIPAVHTDFIFSAIGEETGLLGSMGLILIYLLIVYRGYKIALSSNDTFSSLIAAGLTSMFAIQTLVIIGGVSKLIPLTGVTLPFISYGGSSLISNFILIGLLINISHKDRMQNE